jgi:5-methylcytosine-specific restriction endonuclease McrA
MTTYIPDHLRRIVTERAGGRCEYCRIHQDDREYAHQIDHIIAEKHSGATDTLNLSLACSVCNWNKGSDICSLDLETDTIVALYHPRRHNWNEHFRLNSGSIEPLTPTGRVTERLLKFNTEVAVQRRRLLILSGSYPEV